MNPPDLAMTDVLAPAFDDAPPAEPWGPRLWLALAAIVIVALAIQSYGITTWPMADDDVPTLVELGLVDIGAETFSVPRDQVGRLPRTLPVWYGFQGFAIALLPEGELSYRIPSLVCGVLTSALVFLVAARWKGLWFAIALAIVLNGSVPFVYSAQLNRFYAMPLLLLVLTFVAMSYPRGGPGMIILTAVLAGLTLLAHNVTLAVFVVAFIGALMAWPIGHASRALVWRSGAAAGLCLLVYAFYIRPLVAGWHSTGNPTPVLVSYAAHLGIPTLALALLGAAISLGRWRDRPAMLWWTLMFAGSICVFLLAPIGWNPRYLLLFMPPAWLLAAHAVELVAGRMGGSVLRVGWYACVALLLLPNLASHFQDGSRHDYRAAAALLEARAQPGQPILSDDAETISYYLPDDLRRTLQVRTKVRVPPEEEFFLVARSNAWMDQPRFRGRHVELLAEIRQRRFDQFSHILRVYRVAPPEDR